MGSAGDDGEEGSDEVDGGGSGGEEHRVVSSVFSPSPSRRISGAASSSLPSSLGGEVERQVVVHLFLANTAALWLERAAVRAALARFIGRGLGLRTRAPLARGVGVAGAMVESDSAEGDGVGGISVSVAMPEVGMAEGVRPPSASFLLSSRRLLLLARSRLLLPVCLATSSSAALPPLADRRNQRHISSVSPSVSRTNLAGIPSLLQRTHAIY